MQASILLGSLSELWNPLVISLTNLTLDGKVTISIVKSSLFNEELCLKDVIDNVVENRGKNQNKEQSSRSKSRNKLKCYYS